MTNAAKNKLFFIIDHDLRNPFAGLMELSEMALEEFDVYTKENYSPF